MQSTTTYAEQLCWIGHPEIPIPFPPWIGRSQQAASLDDVRWLGPEFTLLFLYGSDNHICLYKANDEQSVWYSNSNLAIWGLFVDYLKLCCFRGLSMIIAIPRTDTCDDNMITLMIALMTNWWQIDDKLMTNWWQIDDKLMTNWWQIDDKLMMMMMMMDDDEWYMSNDNR